MNPTAAAEDATGTAVAHLDALRDELRRLGTVVVAFSGGADSAFLAHVATRTLGAGRARCVTAVSPSLAPEELTDCRALATEWGLDHREVATTEFDDPAYVRNDGDRCRHCKEALMEALGPVATVAGRDATVVLGVNLDDLADHRPGQAAAAARGAVFPLVRAGFTKADVREWSRRLGLRTWDKPAAACLASRVPYGTPVTLGTLASVAGAESGLRALGLRELRVRHHGDTARLEVPLGDLGRVVDLHEQVAAAVHAAGYRYVTLDLDGFRSGRLNDALGATSPADPVGAADPAGAAGTGVGR